jgi:hypothetical protein
MSQQIDVDDAVFDALKEHAEPFVDTPNTVLRRLLGIDGTGEVAGKSSRRGKPIGGEVAGSPAGTPQRPPSHRPVKRMKPAAPARTRAAAGTILPEERYELPLLTALIDLGGSAPYRDVMDAVGKILEHELTPADTDQLSSGGVRWKSRLQFVRLRLKDRGFLKPDTPKGIWAISDEGRAAVEKGETR